MQAYIISSLKKDMPSVFGKESKKKELIANLGETYHRIEKEHQISPGDFPNLAKMQVRFNKSPSLSCINQSSIFDDITALTLFLACCITLYKQTVQSRMTS